MTQGCPQTTEMTEATETTTVPRPGGCLASQGTWTKRSIIWREELRRLGPTSIVFGMMMNSDGHDVGCFHVFVLDPDCQSLSKIIIQPHHPGETAVRDFSG